MNKKCLPPVCLCALMTYPLTTLAEDYSGDIHTNDHKWMNLNLMYALKELPRPDKTDHDGHDYFELEFGGRSGILDLYGYVDVFNLANSSSRDKKGASKMFMKLQPRLSLDALFGKDLSVGPFREWYFSTLFNWGGGGATNYGPDGPVEGEDVNNSFWGIGTDVMLPWFGKVGLNLYAMYDMNRKMWNGYQVSTNWFKPFYTFSNGSFVSYQGYIDYQFGGKTTKALYPTSTQPDKDYTTHGGTMFNGFFWHSDRFALGYGLKLYSDVYMIKDGGMAFGSKTKSSGAAHFFDITYKF